MATKTFAPLSTISNTNESADELDAQAEELRRESERRRDRARELRTDRKNTPRALRAIAEEMSVGLRALHDAAIRGELEAWRVGGKDRGELVTTWAAVTAYLAKRPAATPKPAADAGVGDVYEIAVARARGAR